MQWWKSSYFWITIALLFVAAYGFAKGAEKISDPGQPMDSRLPIWYLAGAGIMAFNGYLSHKHHAEIARKSEVKIIDKDKDLSESKE